MAEVDKNRLDKIARMVLYDVPHAQIAQACGITEARISQIIGTEEFKEYMQTIASDRFEQDRSINDGWDTIEATALGSILNRLQWMNDPDFALKAAMMANKAQRRGQFNNRPLDGTGGVRAIVHLSAQFVDKLQQNNVQIVQGKIDGNGTDQKRQDFLAPERIEKMFMPDAKSNEDLLDFFPQQTMVMAE